MTAIPAPRVSQQRYPPIAGYSTSHSQHAQQTSAWSKRAYKGLNSNQIGMVRINLYAYEPTFNAKGQPCIVDVRHYFLILLIFSLYKQGIKEGLRVSSDITTSDLCRLIQETLRLPLVDYCRSVAFDIDEMVIRDASNGGWMRLDPQSDESYFGDMFLKPHPRKKDGGLIFSLPANPKPLVFGLVFNTSVFKKVEEIREAEVRSDTHIAPVIKPEVWLQMYKSWSHSPTAAILPVPEYGPKRKSAARSSNRGPRKVPRRDSQGPKMQAVSADNSSDDDASVPLGIIEGADSHRLGNDNEDSISQDDRPNDADDKDTGEGSHAGDEDSDPEDFSNEVDKIRSTTTIATRGRVADPNLKWSLARQVQVAATVSKMHKPFIPLDFEAMRQGFLEGGVKSTDRSSTSSTSLNYNF